MKKRGIVTDYLPWVLIAVALLALMMIAIFVLKEKAQLENNSNSFNIGL